MGDTFNSMGSNINIFMDQATIQKNINNLEQQSVVAELVRLLEAIQIQVPNLPELVRDEVQNEVAGAIIQAKKEQPDKAKLEAKLKSATSIFTEIPNATSAAVTVGNLLRQAMIACDRLFAV